MQEIVDQAYEAAFTPELWPELCLKIAQEVDAFGASVISISPTYEVRWVASLNSIERLNLFSKSPLRFSNQRPALYLQRNAVGFVRDVDIMTPEQHSDDPIYNQCLRPIGLGWTMGNVYTEPTGHTLIFDVARETVKGSFSEQDRDRMNTLRPDLSRASFVASRLAFEQARSITHAMSAIGLAAAVVGDTGAIIAANAFLEGLSPKIRIGAFDRLSVAASAPNKLVQSAISGLQGKLPGFVQSIPVAADETGDALIIHVAPIKRTSRDIFSRSLGLLIVTPVGRTGNLDAGLLSGLFDLSPSEARVARLVAHGESPEQIGQKLSITVHTVRSHLKQIFVKTGTARQSELSSMLQGLVISRSNAADSVQ